MTWVLWQLGVASAVAVSVPIAYLKLKKIDETKKTKIFKILAVILAGLFAVRYMWGSTGFDGIVRLEGGTLQSKGLNAVTLVVFWLGISAVLCTAISCFYKTSITNRLNVYYVLPIAVLTAAFFPFILQTLVKTTDFSALGAGGILNAAVYALETVAFLAIAVMRALPDIVRDKKPVLPGFDRRSALLFGLTAAAMTLLAAPSYALCAFFGNGPIMGLDDFEQGHRIILYISFAVPFALYYGMRKHSYSGKMSALLYTAFATLVTYARTHLAPDWLSVTSWPLHLCNTAMYIIPICLVLRTEKLFYFTYFINVLGALLAMFIPSYSQINLFSPSIINFWINHACAFFMPLLIVALGIFPRPKLRQFIYSMVGFLIYFVFILIINAWFSNYGKVDYFFLNSDFIVSKLGRWAEDTRLIIWEFSIGGLKFVLYPLYQALFFIVYAAMGLGVWFVYENGFMFTDKYHEMTVLRRGIRLEELAFASQLDGRPKTEPIHPEDKDMIKITNFSKQYGRSKVYAVNNVSLEVHDGEIFGFLGPNGAGKSTIIKSLVGIQPITKGKIEVCGYDIERQSIEAKMHIGFVPDHYALYERLTGREYINYIADLYRVSQEDRDVRIKHFVDIFELTTAFDNQIRTYSHGMKQKIAIIAALVHNPKVWILDEPLTGLDPNSIFQVKETMKEHAKAGNIVFFSSHIMDVVERLCDRFAIIKFGNIIAASTTAEIIKSGVTLENYYMKAIAESDVKALTVEPQRAAVVPARPTEDND
ncbi:MAG: YwaF family protein [Clostridiales bacterium]|jgi:ABC-2 type transport system ATP-binding protein|nr:YwaF family protein [Clostridiales bacterium]